MPNAEMREIVFRDYTHVEIQLLRFNPKPSAGGYASLPDTPLTHTRPAVSAEIARILEHGRALAAAGDFRRAIDYVTEANRGLRSPELYHELMVFRADGFASVGKTGQSPWPPHYEDPFPGHIGLPEIDASALTVEVMGGAFQHHGALWVHGLFPPEQVDALRAGIDTALDARDAFRAGTPQEETQPWYRRIPVNPHVGISRGWVEDGGAVLTADSPRMMYDLLDAFEAYGTIDLVSRYLGERPALSVGKSTLRRVPSTVPPADWHQDGAFLGRDVRTVNVWVALSDCGEHAPGLDIVAQRLPYIVQTGSHGAQHDWTVGPEMVVEMEQAGTPVVSPVFRPGDALLFDQLLLHRTGVRPDMTKMRWAIESWFFAPSTYPTDFGPLII